MALWSRPGKSGGCWGTWEAALPAAAQHSVCPSWLPPPVGCCQHSFLLSLSLGMQTSMPFASRETIWLPTAPNLRDLSVALKQRSEKITLQMWLPQHLQHSRALPRGWPQGLTQTLARDPSAPCLGQCTACEDGGHLQGTRELFGPTGVSEAKQMQNLCTSS